MAARKNHPFMKYIISNLESWNINLLINYPTVFFSTGPMFLNMHYCKYQHDLQARGLEFGVSVLVDELYGGHTEFSFVEHWPGNSWHGSDAAFVFWIYRNWRVVVFGFAGGMFICGCIVFWVTHYRFSYRLVDKQELI
jgi:inositol phosphorylceramide mannosyltransferase catalytic subunit